MTCRLMIIWSDVIVSRLGCRFIVFFSEFVFNILIFSSFLVLAYYDCTVLTFLISKYIGALEAVKKEKELKRPFSMITKSSTFSHPYSSFSFSIFHLFIFFLLFFPFPPPSSFFSLPSHPYYPAAPPLPHIRPPHSPKRVYCV